ncbi:MAG: uracil-DNA glycosylase, partial [Clostridiales bacterium]|nr:uracil-DNA glycosylase [Clostridiales bacterium]
MADEFDKKWEAFEARCKACHNCGLRDGCTNVVIYRGSRKAPLMIIGEAPGENEDIQGLPFVGRSGQLLQNLLGSYGFTNNDYHICNIAK